MMTPADWIAIWYQCLICKRCFSAGEKLITHKETTECGDLYSNLQLRSPENRNSSSCIAAPVKPLSACSAIETSHQSEPLIDATNEGKLRNSEDVREGVELQPNLSVLTHQIVDKNTDESHLYNEFPKNSKTKSSTSCKSRRIRCYFCKGTLTHLAMKNHILIHTKEQPYKCNTCTQTFYRKDYRDTHIAKYHQLAENSTLKIHDTTSSPLPRRLRSQQRTTNGSCPADQRVTDEVLLISQTLPDIKQEVISPEPHEKCKESINSPGPLLDNTSINSAEDLHQNGKEIISKDDAESTIVITSEGDQVSLSDPQGNLQTLTGVHQGLPTETKKTVSGRVICNICGKSFKNRCTLNRHFLIHSDERKFFCSICKKTFYRKDYVQAHMKTNHNEGQSKIRISRKLKISRPLKVLKNQKIPISNYSIPSTGKLKATKGRGKTSTTKQISRQLKSIHSKLRKHICKICDAKFLSSAHLNRHKQSKTHILKFSTSKTKPIKEIQNQTEILNPNSIQTTTLSDQVVSIKRQKFKRHLCQLCKMRFSNLKDLKVHSLTHEPNHANNEKTSDTNNELKTTNEHLENLNTPETNNIITNSTQEQSRPLTDPLHQCKKCPEKFTSYAKFKTHLLIHVEEKIIHKCPVCNRVFRLVESIKKHLIDSSCEHIKHNQCSQCGKRFGRLSHLKFHQRKSCKKIV